MNQMYVLVKIAGRSWSGVYHELADDGSTPLCGAALKGEDWTLRLRERVQDRRQCRQCAVVLMQQQEAITCQP